MKNKQLMVIFLMALFLGNAFPEMAQEKQKKKETPKNAKVTFAVNMYCENCQKKIEKNIAWEKGVKDLRVDLEQKTVYILYNPGKTTESNLQKAIEKLGFTCKKQDAN